ncbi:MAG: SH3 domain-containing protein [Roseburia sp.]|nr:SH3 domain-containing protein [Roseburia sp.]
MKRNMWICAVFSMILCGVLVWCSGVQTAYADQTGTVVTNGGTLNMRSGVGTSSPVIDVIPNGSQVTVIDTAGGSDNNGIWYKIVYNGKEGYVAAAYITLGGVSSSAPAASPAPVATPQPTESPAPTPTPAPQSTPVTVYRTKTTYKKINVSAKLLKESVIQKNTSGKALVVKNQKVVLKKNKSVKIIAEKTKGKTKWFKISFRYKKKTRKGYIKSTELKPVPKKPVGGVVTGVKTALRVRKQPGNSKPYYKVNGRIMVLAKKQYVNVIKVRTVKKKQWYQISFDYYGKTCKGYVQAKYIKLAKTRVQKKVAVTVLSEAQFEEEMTRQGFPDSYKEALRKLHASYPYWQFTAFQTGLDWNTAVAGESKLGLNLISNSKSAAWKSMEEGAYDAETGKWKVFDGSTWVAASREAIMYYMDPRNFLTTEAIFQFEMLEYQAQYQTLDGVNQILSNTPFANTTFTYIDDVTGAEKETSYAAAFLDAAKESGVSPYHLASRSKQEVVTSATTTSIAVTGTTDSYPGIFNFYNIGAYSGASPALNGLKWASEGTTFLRPWNNRYRSIVGGGMYIGSNYINRGQNTGYLQKFNVTATSTYSHQYMTNVEAANSEALKTKNAYNGMLDSVPLVFSIPVYTNMPAETCAAPK